MEPILTSKRSEPARVLAPDLEADVRCATAVAVPVLISADLDMAEWLARLIHDRSNGISEQFVVFRPGEGDLSELKRHLNRSSPARGTLFVSDVARANEHVQTFLRDLLGALQSNPYPPFRVIAATAERLFDRVERGEFDHVLFYRLNEIHIRARGDKVVRTEDRGGDDRRRVRVPGMPGVAAPCGPASGHGVRRQAEAIWPTG